MVSEFQTDLSCFCMPFPPSRWAFCIHFYSEVQRHSPSLSYWSVTHANRIGYFWVCTVYFVCVCHLNFRRISHENILQLSTPDYNTVNNRANYTPTSFADSVTCCFSSRDGNTVLFKRRQRICGSSNNNALNGNPIAGKTSNDLLEAHLLTTEPKIFAGEDPSSAQRVGRGTGIELTRRRSRSSRIRWILLAAALDGWVDRIGTPPPLSVCRSSV
jgi:hypothetical protein